MVGGGGGGGGGVRGRGAWLSGEGVSVSSKKWGGDGKLVQSLL